MCQAERLDDAEFFYPLHVRICDSCLLVQLPAYVPEEDIFSDYAYFSSYSDSWVAHAKQYAQTIIGRLGLNADSLVTEVASNDGYLLQHFLAAGIPVLGIDPAANVAEAARARGIRTEVRVPRPRDGPGDRAASRAEPISSQRTTSSPTFLISEASPQGSALWSKDSGLVTLEFPHLLRLIERRQYDTIYHEHYLLPFSAHLVPGAGHSRAAGGRRRRAQHAWRLAARLRPAAGARWRADRAG